MGKQTIKSWSWVHKWTSLLCTLFLLMLCLTGLPLIFHDEIDGALNTDSWTPANPAAEHLTLDEILDTALENRPGEVPIFMSFDIDRPVVNVTSGPSADAPGSAMHFASFDLTSGNLVPPADNGESVMEFILQLHTDMFLGLPGMLFLGFMGILFVLSVVSGVVLYAPFMRKLEFGTVRRQQSKRLKWLDYHNLLGIVAVAWLLVVGLTGVINTLEEPIIETWKSQELAGLVASNEGVAASASRASLDAAVNAAIEEAPDMELQFVAFPGSGFSTKAHYAVFLHGRTPVSEHVIAPVLIHAGTGEVAGLREMPWYAKALSLSRPLHFGDYGGLLLKLVWAVLDLLTIFLLVTGVYLWLARGNRRMRVERQLDTGEVLKA
ncbi:MAG TPA: PepSY domain-containing protein [Henriciella marina]|uniref:PepSY-associated TM helix domain-containing protein n=1 Tax=Henriciella sp. TaxID=1968823 RepID=UPI0017A48DC8|nr:PepSY domain-containing protein [Henriciella sp.]HIG21060.1 PepSY domain-containing protein [Henriciella sp.]HIK63499.1 PepSY domain-containing protein [Henriciella marina]